MQICNKFTGEQPCWKLLRNFIEITLRHGCSPVYLLHIFRRPFLKDTSEWLLLVACNLTCSIAIHLSQLSSCWIWNLIFSWVQFLSSKLKFFVSSNVKIRTSFFCSVCWYILFYKNLIVLHHGDNNFLLYFEICIKFTLSTIIQRRRKDNNSLDV